MGTLKKITSSTDKTGQETAKRGGALVRIDTGERISYDPDPERSLPHVTAAQRQQAVERYDSAVKKARESRTAAAGGGADSEEAPGLLERLGSAAKSVLSGAASNTASAWGTLFENTRGTAMTSIYEDQLRSIDLRIAAAEKQLQNASADDPMREFLREDLDQLLSQKSIYEQAVRANRGIGDAAVKAADEALGGLAGKHVMVIGGTGQIGGIVLKNLYSMKGLHIYSTIRNVTLTHDAHMKSESNTLIDYKDRYEYLDQMDVVISATASPHYTLTCARVKEKLVTDKPRVFVDLAVPVDIEESIAGLPRTFFYNMDDFEELARANNQAKKQAVRQAGEILEEYQKDFMCWMIFQQAVPQLQAVKAWMEEEAEKKGLGRAIDKLFYRIRENAEPEELRAFLRCIRPEEAGGK